MKLLIVFGILLVAVLLSMGCIQQKIECEHSLNKKDCERAGGTYVDGPEVSCMAIGCPVPRHCDCSEVN